MWGFVLDSPPTLPIGLHLELYLFGHRTNLSHPFEAGKNSQEEKELTVQVEAAEFKTFTFTCIFLADYYLLEHDLPQIVLDLIFLRYLTSPG